MFLRESEIAHLKGLSKSMTSQEIMDLNQSKKRADNLQNIVSFSLGGVVVLSGEQWTLALGALGAHFVLRGISAVRVASKLNILKDESIFSQRPNNSYAALI